MTPGGTGSLVIVLSLIVLAVAVTVVVLRWAFRVNDIVNRLDNIVELMRKAQGAVK